MKQEPNHNPQILKNQIIISIDVNSVEYSEVRHIGAETLGVHAAIQLELEPLLKKLGFNQKKCHLAMASIIGRLVAPGSEASTHRYLTDQSALDELLGTNFTDLSQKNFYKIADDLLKHKEQIERALFNREKTLFSLNQIITLYDITNTYFEGRAFAKHKSKAWAFKRKALGLSFGVNGLGARFFWLSTKK